MIGLKGWTLYVVECADKSYYTGWTRNLEKELIKMRLLILPHFKRCPSRLPVRVVFQEKNVPFLEAYAKFNYLREMNRYLKNKLIRTQEWPMGGAWKRFLNKRLK